jgi:hypothetical protein
MKTMMLVDPDALDALTAELKRLHNRLDQVEMAPRPEWITIDHCAKSLGKHRKTILRRIEAGQIEAREICGERLVRFNPDA